MPKPSYHRSYLTPDLPKRSCGAKLGVHMKKHWLLHLLIFCIGFLAIALVLVYAAYPAIAKHDVNASTLAISRMVIADPTPDSFMLSLDQNIGSKSVFHPDMRKFKAEIELMGASNPFATVEVPGLHVRDGTSINIGDQLLNLSSSYEFTEYSKAVMLNEEVTLIIKGYPLLKLGALPAIKVSYDKSVVMKGLNKLNGFSVVDYHMDLASTSGRNMFGHVYIPNPTLMTITMGNITLNLFLDGSFIGNSYLNDIVLKPGNNTVPMSSNINAMQILTFMASPENSKTYSNGVVPFVVTGNSSVYHGIELPYFTEALQANDLTIHLNVTKGLEELGITL